VRGASDIASYRDLRVWKQGMRLVREIYRTTQAFPQSELFGLVAQMRRAAVSVPSNIAEGHTRGYTREYVHHIAIAHGSLAEVITLIEIAADLGYIDEAEHTRLATDADALSRQINALRTALNERVARSQLATTPPPHSSHPTPHSSSVS
jgi:four helix bundle protein